MHATTPPAAPLQEQQETAPAIRRQPLGLDARMAAASEAVADRCRIALLRLDIDSALPATRIDWADVVRGPVQLPTDDEDLEPYPTPAAATLQRAARRLRDRGWCRRRVADEDGRRCLYGAITAEAPTGRAESDALDVLLDVIRRQWPNAESVPETNDRRLRSAAAAVHLLDTAAYTAHARGL